MKHKLSTILFTTIFLASSTLGLTTPDITAEGAVLLEPHTNTILYSKNMNATLYPASTTKVLTSVILLEEMIDPNFIINKSYDSIVNVPSNSSHIGLLAGDTFTYLDALYAIMMSSDNFVSYDMGIYNAGSTYAFTNKMNEYAHSLGAINSNFVNAHGYHDPDHYTTPYDLALITKHAFANEELVSIAGQYQYDFSVLNRNMTIPLTHTAVLFNPDSEFYNPNVVAAKTGFHTPAGRTLVGKAVYDDIELIGVVMKADSPNQFEDLNALFEYGSNSFKTHYKGSNVYGVENISYSEWAKPFIDGALSAGLITPSTRNFQSSVSTDEFTFLVEKAIGIVPLSSEYEILFTSPTLNSTDQLTLIDAATILCNYFNTIILNNYRLTDNFLYTNNYNLSLDQTVSLSTLDNIGIINIVDETFDPYKIISYEEVISLIYKTHKIALRFPYVFKF